ncbi:MAG: quinohemoprotein amine dehydrogenase subunit alpha [Bryobacterales bacterium]|nr:quinohemoprotein amine dehydrogenase subunit alpha [Bryobacterales bacterium]MBV9400640.1 quinohemoprotein amine dehydrogenase subunit alpha [Bryobacterales bacterium]
MSSHARFVGVAGLLFMALSIVHAQSGSQPDVAGIPINDQLTISKCGGCHRRDPAGLMTRISYIRTTPEVWEQAIKRMIRLNGLSATPQEVRDIVRYLSNNNGLAPEEMAAGFWEVEHRTQGYQDDHVSNPALQKTCNNCHNIGRVLAQRRTREDYQKLLAMHIGMFPSAENVFRPQRTKAVPIEEAPVHLTANDTGGINREAPRATAASAVNAKAPGAIAVDYLATSQPLITPEWTAWRAAMRAPKLAGTWLVSAYQPGRGRIYGQVVITPGASDDLFSTTTQLTYASSGASLKLTGKSIVYTGYSWRGRSGAAAMSPLPVTAASAPVTAASGIPAEWREAMMVSRDGNSMDGRWFWSGFGELGMDVHLVRASAEPAILGTDISALQSPSHGQVKIFGGNLPSSLQPSDFIFGPGITVTKVVNATPTLATIEVDIAAKAPVGMRDLTIGRAGKIKALAVYDKIAYIEVSPNAQISRLGGIKWPKEFAQYEARAYAAGPDGKPHTADDLDLGPVSAQWSMEEFFSTPDDDDILFVGKIDDSGLFTPSFEGPNPERKKVNSNFGVDNYGDVWAVATYKDAAGVTHKAKSYLVVTVPNYTLYDQPEVAQQ